MLCRRGMASRLVRLIAPLALLAVAPTPGLAQGAGSGPEIEESVDTAVARALIRRGNALFGDRDYANARTMFIEALEKDPTGPHAKSALAMLRRANAKLGRYKDDGRPKGSGVPAPPRGGEGVIDPYAGGGSGGTDHRAAAPPTSLPDAAAAPGVRPLRHRSSSSSQRDWMMICPIYWRRPLWRRRLLVAHVRRR